ncbi:MAG: 5-formyltetrahydrofolate cyclo-ligase [Alphaproteobacteria bacterium]|nr:5-formyltetrahydrofolate cyclo-ligase [Alphaproteobacteria bacterium]NNF23545.1 5-formyltetrahydrofolate cyclo-ligase [Paracoccaceae bacterium]
MSLQAAKAAARKEAFARRRIAKPDAAAERAAQTHLAACLAPHAGGILAGYMPIRTEIDPLPVMAAWTTSVCVPVIAGAGTPLEFHRWSPGCDMTDGPFGARVPARADPLIPDIVIVPLVAFDAGGARLGYGGGYYDRTLQHLRTRGPVLAIGFAFGAQRAPAPLPQEPTDQPLGAIVTERGIARCGEAP